MKAQCKSIARYVTTNQRGFSLVEVIIGLAIILIAATSSVGLFVRAIRGSVETEHVTAATYIARSHLEEIKTTDFGYITSLYWDGDPRAVSDPALPTGATWTVTYPSGAGTNLLTVVVTVSWLEDGQTKSVQLTTQIASP